MLRPSKMSFIKIVFRTTKYYHLRAFQNIHFISHIIMKRGIGFGKIGLNIGQMKLGDKEEQLKEDSEKGTEAGFGSFGSFNNKEKDRNEITNLVNEEEKTEESDFVDDVNPDIAKVMGFSGFSSTTHKKGTDKLTPKTKNTTAVPTKKAQQFDVDSMFAAVAKSAFEKNFDQNQKLEEEGRAELESDYVPRVGESTRTVKQSPSEKVSDNDSDNDNDSDDSDIVGPAPPPPSDNTRKPKSRVKGDDDDEDEEEEGEREETPVDRIPHSHEVSLAHGDKAITSLALDPSGSRVISGGADYELKFWDFAGEQILYKFGLVKTVYSIFVLLSLSNSITRECLLNVVIYLTKYFVTYKITIQRSEH